MNGRNLISLWWFDIDLGVFYASTQNSKLIAPVLEYDAIGKDGNFNKPFTYELTYADSLDINHSNAVHVSRNKVPECVKRIFREFIRSGAETRTGMKQAEVGV